MTSNPLLRIAFATVLVSTLSLMPAAANGEDAAQKPQEPTMESIVSQSEKLDKEMQEAVRGFQKLIMQEEEANRVSAEDAKWMRANLPSNGAELVSVRSLLGGMKIPTNNTVLNEGSGKLKATVEAYAQKRAVLYKSAAEAIQSQIGKALREAKSVEAVDALLPQIDAFRAAIAGASGDTKFEVENVMERAQTALRGLRRVVEVQGSGDRQQIYLALEQLNDPFRSFFSKALHDMNTRAEMATGQFRAEYDDAQKLLDQAILERKSASEIGALVQRFERAHEQLSPFNRFLGGSPREPLPAYRAMAALLVAIEKDERGSYGIESARQQLQGLDQDRIAKFDQFLKELGRKPAQPAKRSVGNLGPRIAAVKQLGDLEALVDELGGGSLRVLDNDPRVVNQINQLTSLASAWRNQSMAMLGQAEGNAPAEPAFTVLRDRVEREVLAKSLRVPELLQAPLADKPLAPALDLLSEQLVKQREWRRLYRLLQNLPRGAEMFGTGGERAEMVGVLRSYLSGQNLERAEQWTEAAEAYRTVLRSANERIPTAEAAERLKVLSKEHPAETAKRLPAAQKPVDKLPRAGFEVEPE